LSLYVYELVLEKVVVLCMRMLVYNYISDG